MVNGKLIHYFYDHFPLKVGIIYGGFGISINQSVTYIMTLWKARSFLDLICSYHQ